MERLIELWVRRDGLECELLDLEQVIGQQRRVCSAAMAGEAWQQVADLTQYINRLVTRFAAVNAELAAMCGMPGQV